MIINPDQISSEALENLISEYCLRDWGLNEIESPLEQRQQQVKKALDKGELVILYSEYHESAQLSAASDLKLS